jgi:hypothetical protein
MERREETYPEQVGAYGASPARGGPETAECPGGSVCQSCLPQQAGGAWYGVAQAGHGGVVRQGGRSALR